MRRSAIFFVSCLVAGALFAGCSGKPSTPQLATTSSGTDAGSVAGVVLDEALLPVADAEVGIRLANLTTVASTTSDAAGQFLLTGVPPGSYELLASKVGYSYPTTHRFTVGAGQKVEGVEVRLAAAAPARVPFVDRFIENGFISCAVQQGIVGFSRTQPCGFEGSNKPAYRFKVNRTDGLVAVVLEMTWTPTNSVVGEKLRQALWLSPFCDTRHCDTGLDYGGVNGKSPLRHAYGNLSHPLQDGINGTGSTTLAAMALVPERETVFDTYVVYQQAVTHYVSVFYNEEPSPEYSLAKS